MFSAHAAPDRSHDTITNRETVRYFLVVGYRGRQSSLLDALRTLHAVRNAARRRPGTERRDATVSIDTSTDFLSWPRGGVVIAGAGPAGLVSATILARAGIKVTVLEAEPELPLNLRASTFHPPTLDMLDELDVADALIEQGLKAPTLQYRDRSSGLIAQFDFGAIADQTRHPFRVQYEQFRLTRISQTHLGGVSSGADEPGCGSICVALRQSGPGLIV